jgi:hypothetical protein
MAISMVKEQLNYFKIKKVNKEECKNLVAWWKTHEVHFSYVGFVAWQILEIVGFHIEAKRIFNIIDICSSLWCSHLAWIILKCL